MRGETIPVVYFNVMPPKDVYVFKKAGFLGVNSLIFDSTINPR
jgi:hypothetical protein